ncbi:MAG: DsbA family protein [Cellulomonas sp.]|nr:DsbA family protein [Actinomycetota bacterium]MCG2800051.1 DsbA family protein [Cellulomonas sp.]
MSHQRSARQKAAAKDRRAENRTLADAERRRRHRNATLRKAGLWTGAVIVVVAIVGGIGLAIRARILAGQVGPTNMASDGLLITGDGSKLTPTTTAPLAAGGTPTPSATDSRSSGVIDFVVYVDYGDPRSASFWQTSGGLLVQAATSGYATLEIHPVALSASRADYTATPAPSASAAAGQAASAAPSASATPTATPNPLVTAVDYSQRAANAFACVASFAPSDAVAMNQALFTAQTTFGSAGLSDAELVTTAKGAGATGKDVASCITSHSYVDWVQEASQRAVLSTPFDAVGSLRETPTVVVAGEPYTGSVSDLQAFYAFVSQVYSSLTAAASNASPGAATAQPSATATP